VKQKPRGYWEDIENRRKFFNDYAAEMGFDPKDPTKWKQVTRAELVAKKVRLLLSCPQCAQFSFSCRELAHCQASGITHSS